MTRLPETTGLFETHLSVSDLGRSVAFYRDVVGLSLALDLPERGAAFFWIGGPGETMLGLWSLGSAPMGLSLHIALRASLADVLSACDALRSVGVGHSPGIEELADTLTGSPVGSKLPTAALATLELLARAGATPVPARRSSSTSSAPATWSDRSVDQRCGSSAAVVARTATVASAGFDR